MDSVMIMKKPSNLSSYFAVTYIETSVSTNCSRPSTEPVNKSLKLSTTMRPDAKQIMSEMNQMTRGLLRH